MTKAGTINTQSVSMLRERLRSIGVSLLGGNSGIEGPYELGIDEIRAVNEEDVTVPPRTFIMSKSDVYASRQCFIVDNSLPHQEPRAQWEQGPI
jgi:hypothetical protein